MILSDLKQKATLYILYIFLIITLKTLKKTLKCKVGKWGLSNDTLNLWFFFQ